MNSALVLFFKQKQGSLLDNNLFNSAVFKSDHWYSALFPWPKESAVQRPGVGRYILGIKKIC